MPLLSVARFFTALLSLAILAAGGYLLWSWYEGAWVRTDGGQLERVREAWRLWSGLGLLAWSFVGRFAVLFLTTRPDIRRSNARHGQAQVITTAAGSSLHVETSGPLGAPPIIFTHGWGMDSTFWSYAKRDLSDRFRLILWDLPGLGKSKPSQTDAINLTTFARDLLGLLEVSGRQPAVLVGHSIGGMTIQTLLRDHPQIHRRLAGVVLLNTTYTNPVRTMIFSGLLGALQKPLLEPALRLTMWLHPLAWRRSGRAISAGPATWRTASALESS